MLLERHTGKQSDADSDKDDDDETVQTIVHPSHRHHHNSLVTANITTVTNMKHVKYDGCVTT